MSRRCIAWVPLFVAIMCCDSFGWVRCFRADELTKLDPLYCSMNPRPNEQLPQPPVYAYAINGSLTYYYAGETPSLNRFLRRLAEKVSQAPAEQWYKHVSARLVVHAGVGRVASPVPDFNQSIHADWRLDEVPSVKSLDGGKVLLHELLYTVHVWLGEAIQLEQLDVPEGIKVESGGEIERFIKKRELSESSDAK